MAYYYYLTISYELLLLHLVDLGQPFILLLLGEKEIMRETSSALLEGHARRRNPFGYTLSIAGYTPIPCSLHSVSSNSPPQSLTRAPYGYPAFLEIVDHYDDGCCCCCCCCCSSGGISVCDVGNEDDDVCKGCTAPPPLVELFTTVCIADVAGRGARMGACGPPYTW